MVDQKNGIVPTPQESDEERREALLKELYEDCRIPWWFEGDEYTPGIHRGSSLVLQGDAEKGMPEGTKTTVLTLQPR